MNNGFKVFNKNRVELGMIWNARYLIIRRTRLSKNIFTCILYILIRFWSHVNVSMVNASVLLLALLVLLLLVLLNYKYRRAGLNLTNTNKKVARNILPRWWRLTKSLWETLILCFIDVFVQAGITWI